MTEENKKYQISLFLSPLLNETKLKETIEKIKSLLGQDIESTTPTKKTLAYPIKKFQEAFYLNLNFLLPTQSVNQISQQLNLEENIIRYLITAKQKPKPKFAPSRGQVKEPFDSKLIDKIEPLEKKEKPEPEKVKIEELDKKLEEILSQ